MPSGGSTSKKGTAKAKAVKKTTKTTKKKTTKKRSTTRKVTAAAESARPLRVRQVRSGIGHPRAFRRTLAALGLKHHQDEVTLPDNPSVRGMLRQVSHLISVTTEATNG